MKLRKAIKKIAAVGTATLMGATILASAADLSQYPAPFIDDGKFSGMLVVGDKAAAADVVGVSDIAISLQFAATKEVGTATTTTTVEGDAWRVGSSSKDLELTGNYASATTGNETIRDILNSIDEDELNALADGSVTTEKGTAGYNQYINFDDVAKNGGYVKFLEDDDDLASDFLYFKSGVSIARYSLEFKTSFQSDVEDSSGSKTSTGTYLGDYEDETLSLLGRDYSIVKARRVSSAGTSAELTLMGGSHKDSLSEGETKTYTIDGKDYEVTVTAITDTGTIVAKFNVNGESTRSLKDGDSATLSDGTELGISDIIPNEAGDVTQDIVEFYLGASKIFLKDTLVSDTASSNSLEVGSEKIDDAFVKITGSDDNATFSIDTIEINVTADDDYWVAPGHALSEYMDEPEAFLEAWDIRYDGLDSVEVEMAEIKTSGSDQYKLTFADGDGNEATVPIAYTSSGTNLHLGDNDDNLILLNNETIEKNDYIIVSDESQEDGNRKTYALRYKGADKVASGETALVKFDNLGTGDRIEQTFTSATGDTADATLKLGGATFAVINASADTADDFNIRVDLDADGTITADGSFVAINTDSGLKINIDNRTDGADPNVHTDKVRVTFSTPDGNDYDNQAPQHVALDITAASGEVAFAANNSNDGGNWVAPSEEKNTKYLYTTQGAKFVHDDPTSDPDLLTVEYPIEQRLPLVYVTAGETEVTVGSSESVESVTINKIEVGATKLASEISNSAAQNLIVVGGPCANSVAADVKGTGDDCAAGYEAGKGLIELVDTGAGNVALVVAGYSADDTRAATTVVANYGDYELAGMRMEVTTATSTVKEVAEVEAEPEPEPEAEEPAAEEDPEVQEGEPE